MLQLNKNKLVLKCWVGNFNCFNVSFVEEGGGFPKFKIFPISTFSQIRSNFHFFKIQKNLKHPGGGGQENYGLFPLFVTFFLFRPFP